MFFPQNKQFNVLTFLRFSKFDVSTKEFTLENVVDMPFEQNSKYM